MLPEALQGTEGPAEALLNEALDRIGRLGPGDRGALVQHGVASLLDGDGQILVLGERIGGKSAKPLKRLAPPRADGARHNGDAAKARQSAALEILARDIFDRLP